MRRVRTESSAAENRVAIRLARGTGAHARSTRLARPARARTRTAVRRISGQVEALGPTRRVAGDGAHALAAPADLLGPAHPAACAAVRRVGRGHASSAAHDSAGAGADAARARLVGPARSITATAVQGRARDVDAGPSARQGARKRARASCIATDEAGCTHGAAAAAVSRVVACVYAAATAVVRPLRGTPAGTVDADLARAAAPRTGAAVFFVGRRIHAARACAAVRLSHGRARARAVATLECPETRSAAIAACASIAAQVYASDLRAVVGCRRVDARAASVDARSTLAACGAAVSAVRNIAAQVDASIVAVGEIAVGARTRPRAACLVRATRIPARAAVKRIIGRHRTPVADPTIVDCTVAVIVQTVGTDLVRAVGDAAANRRFESRCVDATPVGCCGAIAVHRAGASADRPFARDRDAERRRAVLGCRTVLAETGADGTTIGERSSVVLAASQGE